MKLRKLPGLKEGEIVEQNLAIRTVVVLKWEKA